MVFFLPPKTFYFLFLLFIYFSQEHVLTEHVGGCGQNSVAPYHGCSTELSPTARPFTEDRSEHHRIERTCVGTESAMYGQQSTTHEQYSSSSLDRGTSQTLPIRTDQGTTLSKSSGDPNAVARLAAVAKSADPLAIFARYHQEGTGPAFYHHEVIDASASSHKVSVPGILSGKVTKSSNHKEGIILAINTEPPPEAWSFHF